MVRRTDTAKGFTIVELLVVIVVIAILAAIVTVTYRGVQNNAYDASVKNDLLNIGKTFRLYQVDKSVFPPTVGDINTLNIKVNKSAFGSHFDNGTNTYNLLYCRIPAGAPTIMALIAYSKSGNGFQYSPEGQVKEYTGPKTGSNFMCPAVGITTTGAANERDWMFNAGAWEWYIKD